VTLLTSKKTTKRAPLLLLAVTALACDRGSLEGVGAPCDEISACRPAFRCVAGRCEARPTDGGVARGAEAGVPALDGAADLGPGASVDALLRDDGAWDDVAAGDARGDAAMLDAAADRTADAGPPSDASVALGDGPAGMVDGRADAALDDAPAGVDAPGSPDVAMDLPPEAALDAELDVPADLSPLLAPDMAADSAAPTMLDMTVDLAVDVAPDLPPDVGLDVAPDVAPDVGASDAPPDVGPACQRVPMCMVDGLCESTCESANSCIPDCGPIGLAGGGSRARNVGWIESSTFVVAECGSRQALTGLAAAPTMLVPHSVICSVDTPAFDHFPTSCAERAFTLTVPSEQSWAPAGSVAIECPAGRLAVGLAHSGLAPDVPQEVVHAIGCCQAPGPRRDCVVRRLGAADGREIGTSGDFAPGQSKAECGPGRFIAGLARDNVSAIPMWGKPTAILCCGL
jgi:hypothetical protein